MKRSMIIVIVGAVILLGGGIAWYVFGQKDQRNLEGVVKPVDETT